MNASQSVVTLSQYNKSEIREELNLHAKVSGNEELFFEQLGLK